MVEVICGKCSTKFYTKPSQIKYGHGKYCSRKCQYSARRVGKLVPCFICGKEKYKPLAKFNRVKSGKFFCSKSCQTKWRNTEFIGSKHANWVNGYTIYRSTLKKSLLMEICRLCKTIDKRVLAVHHIDKNRKNNSLSNLDWLCYNCHFLVHHHKNEYRKFVSERKKVKM